MLNFKNIAIRRGHHLLFSEMSLTIHKGQRVGVTGANGAGKSSLFALIRNELQPDEGDFTMPPELEVAHVAQETPAAAMSAIDYVIDGDRELRSLQRQLATAERDADGVRQAEILAKLDDIGGYTASSRASRLLSGLGFSTERQQHAVSEFSGGWRMRLNLAQALMCRSDVLLLDEPTNHLDLDAVFWLQDWLEKYSGTLLLISHDRDFLDTLATHIVHIEHQKVDLYTGNYSAFEQLRAEKLAQQQSAFQKQQREIAHIQHFIERFRAKATKAKQAQSRIKSLQRMTVTAQAQIDSSFHFSFPAPDKMPNPLLRLETVNVGYGATDILSSVNLSLAPGDRIGLLGPNGAGKSTLIKLMVGDLPPRSGVRSVSETLRIGYFAQHQLEQLQLDQSPLQHLQQLDPQATEKDLRNFLGGFNFVGDKALQEVAPFSGGEKARLVLAMLVYQNPNLLLLDEPTNHLDLEMRHALSVALQDYQGAIVVVSHDRHLLRLVADQLVLVAAGRVQSFAGDLDDYRSWLAERRNSANQTRGRTTPPPSKKEQRRNEAEIRQKLKPLRDALAKIEHEVARLHQDQQQIEQQLADPELYTESEKERLKNLLQQKAAVDNALNEAEHCWLQASENLESAQE